MNLEKLQMVHEKFCKERGWEQYHNPKNLVMALTGEVGELTEIFQWLSEEQSQLIMEDPKKAGQVKNEIADIMIYLSRICRLLEVDLEQACNDKFYENERKYPIHLSRGNSLKYTEFMNGEVDF